MKGGIGGEKDEREGQKEERGGGREKQEVKKGKREAEWQTGGRKGEMIE